MDRPAGVPPSDSPQDAARPLLRSAWERGRRAHPGVELSEDAFVTRAFVAIRRRFEQSDNALADEIVAAIEIFPAEDFYLSTACEMNVPGAWEKFICEYAPRLAPSLRKLWSACDAPAVARDVCGDMALPPKDGSTRTKLGGFQGLGSLINWLLMCARRHVISTKKLAARNPAELLELHDPQSPEAAPFDLAADSEEAGRLRAILADIWKALSSKEALAITLKHATGLSQRSIAMLLDLSESRVSRILDSALWKLRGGVNRALGPEEGLGAPRAGVLKPLASALEAQMAKNSDVVLDLHRRGLDS